MYQQQQVRFLSYNDDNEFFLPEVIQEVKKHRKNMESPLSLAMKVENICHLWIFTQNLHRKQQLHYVMYILKCAPVLHQHPGVLWWDKHSWIKQKLPNIWKRRDVDVCDPSPCSVTNPAICHPFTSPVATCQQPGARNYITCIACWNYHNLSYVAALFVLPVFSQLNG